MDIVAKMHECKIIPVVVMEKAQDAPATARALLEGGIDMMEITFRTAAAEESIRLVSGQCPEMIVGAGTVLTIEQASRALQAGARFIVSPGFDAELVRWCIERDVAVIPGCVTPSEIMGALRLGLHVVKFFPANVYGGLPAMKALSAPFGQLRFLPTGGVNGDNVGEYYAAPFVHAVGGSWICTKADIAAGAFERITELTRRALAACKG